MTLHNASNGIEVIALPDCLYFPRPYLTSTYPTYA